MIQINIEMPENCLQCPILDGQDGYCRITNEDAPMDGRPESCPLQEAEVEVRCIDCEHLRTMLTQGKHLPGAICVSPVWKELGRAPHVVKHDLYEPILCDHFEKKEGKHDGTNH